MSGKKRVQSNGNNNNNILNVNNNNNNNRISIAEEVDNVGFDVLVKEFNVYKLRDFFPKRPAKITIRKQLLTGSISIVVERAGVARIHKAGSIRGASFEAQNTQFFSDSNSTNADIVTYQIDYYNQKSDMFESHQRSKICNAINEALKLSQMNPQNQRLSKQFNLYSDGGDAFMGLSLYDFILQNKVPIYTYIDGMIASAATFMTPPRFALFSIPKWKSYCWHSIQRPQPP